MSLPQPPEGVLDPKHPWHLGKIGEKTWIILKAKLTGGEAFGTGYSSTVNLTSADADKLIENLKKDPRGYPQFNSTGGALEYENQQKYQEWLREEYLEKPFRQQVDAKIEEAEIESRLSEISGEKKRKKEEEEKKKEDEESVPLPSIQEEKKEQDILDSDQEAIEEQVEEITTGLDSVREEEKKAETPKQTPEEDSTKLDSDIEAISDSLLTIKGSLSNQISDLGSIERDSIKSLSSLEGLKQLFQAQTDIIKRELGTSESKGRESSLEESNVVSGTDEATSTTADNKAEGIIQGVDGPTITVKTTEGEFRQGQKISQGGAGGGGLFDMLKGIAGKFMGGGKGGGGAGGSPLKMSRGGIAVSPTKLAGGAFSPGIYSKPTRGNLGPGQAVVPLNRNIGKKMFPDQLKQIIKFHQPLADVMAQPLKAIGLSILSVAGNFLRLLGPLAGFFTPYVSGLVKGFATVLGVPVAIVGALLGGPAYAAMEDQERQQNVFAKLWASLMEKFGFSSSDDEKKKKKKGKNGSDSTGQYVPIDWKQDPAFGEAVNKVAQHFNINAADLMGLMASESGLRPDADNGSHVGLIQFSATSAIAAGTTQAALKKMSRAEQMPYVQKYLENAKLPKGASAGQLYTAVFLPAFVGKPDDFVVANKGGTEPYGYPESKSWYSGNKGLDMNNDGKLTISELGERIQKKKKEFKISAESGTATSDSSMGKMLGWSIVKGPNSGYDVDPTLEMHGEEAYLQYEKGFTILPIENNEYSLRKKPKETLTRWQELMNPNEKSPPDKDNGGGGTTSAAKGVSKRETMVERIFNFAKKDFMNAFTSNKPSKPALATLPASARQVTQYPEGVSTGMGGGNAGASTAPRPAARRPARSPIGNPAPKNTPEIKKVPSETDVMMEQYEALAAAGKHSEAKELGMKIWNKTWRKTEKGIERIPTTPITATNATLPTASASAPTAASSPQQIMVPIPASGGGAPAIVLPRTMKEEMELVTLKNLC